MDNLLSRALGSDASQPMAEQRQVLLSRLVARLAHEVRNPLSSLDVHVQLLEEDLAKMPSAAPKLVDRLAIIRAELRRLDSVVQQFVSLAGPSSANLLPVNVAHVIAHVQRLFEPEAATRQIRLETHLAPDLPLVQADTAQLTQALVNLVINAIQAIERNGTVMITAAQDAADGAVRIEITDTGPGIHATKSAALFEPYFTTKAEGTGLGLWIVQQIISAHGGTVSATNAEEGGARFVLRLPRPAPVTL